jgi:acyl-coenzyme A thioesterase PaaI-like protein
MALPLVAEAVALRAGRRLFTAEVRISEEASGKLVSQATGTYALSGNGPPVGVSVNWQD